MQDEHSIIGKILAKYPDLTDEERQILNEWQVRDNNQVIFDTIVNDETRLADLNRFLQIRKKKEANREKYHAAIVSLPGKAKAMWWQRWQTFVAAASIIAAISFIGLKWFGAKDKGATIEAPTVAKFNDVEPGQFKARLTLSDGSVIVLDSAQNKLLAQQAGTTVINKDGKLVYSPSSGAKREKSEVLYNTLTTAKGETYGTILSDGSKVWLNSQSSIRYPVSFNSDIRKVQITGEAYFEVAKGRGPFKVEVNDMIVEVLGTHFNINSYRDEDAIKTTLLEGIVRVSKGNSSTVLAPGQQASLNKGTQQLSKLENADVEEALAWRFGYFQFEDADLKAVLRQIVRWYDVEVAYEGKVPEMTFVGKISRNNNLSSLLKTLETNEIHFRLEGKKIVVFP